MKKSAVITVILVGSLLAGCSTYKDINVYHRPGTVAELRCVNQCAFQRLYCRSHCQERDSACLSTARSNAKSNFDAYLKAQSVQHKPAVRTLDDFIDYSKCHLSCNCEATFNSCFVGCGGKITNKNICITNCSYVR